MNYRIDLYCTKAYPGSWLYDLSVQVSWLMLEKWSGYSQHAVDILPLPAKYLSSAGVLRFRYHAFQVYFNDPKYLDMITLKFGPVTAQYTREMAAHKLVRKHARQIMKIISGGQMNRRWWR